MRQLRWVLRSIAGHKEHRFVLLVTLIALAINRPALGQQAVTGAVLNSRSLQPIAGAQIAITGSNLRATSNAQGQFRIEGAGSGEVTLRATAIGYQPVTLTARAGTSVRLLLSEMAVNLGEVVVTGTVGAVEKRAVANAVSKISATDAV